MVFSISLDTWSKVTVSCCAIADSDSGKDKKEKSIPTNCSKTNERKHVTARWYYHFKWLAKFPP